MKLLLIEDEADLAAMLAKGLRKKGYAVDMAYDGEEGLYLYGINEYDLIILDLNIPVIDGLEVLRNIRQENKQIKILILSARTEVEQKVDGLNLGANDYMGKPFDFLELEARINVLLRMEFTQYPTEQICGKIKMNLITKTVSVDSVPVTLTRKEYSVLEYLFRNKNEVVSAERLIEHVWESDTDLFSNSLKYHIHMLKKKLGGAYIRNIRGCGYILSEEGACEAFDI